VGLLQCSIRTEGAHGTVRSRADCTRDAREDRELQRSFNGEAFRRFRVRGRSRGASEFFLRRHESWTSGLTCTPSVETTAGRAWAVAATLDYEPVVRALRAPHHVLTNRLQCIPSRVGPTSDSHTEHSWHSSSVGPCRQPSELSHFRGGVSNGCIDQCDRVGDAGDGGSQQTSGGGRGSALWGAFARSCTGPWGLVGSAVVVGIGIYMF